jgi:hypothetical protein
MVGFQLPTSIQVSRERVPPEVEELSLLLEALDIVPDVAPCAQGGHVAAEDRRGTRADQALGSGRGLRHTPGGGSNTWAQPQL